MCQLHHIAWNGAASQPSAGQARSPQRARSPREPHFLRLCHRKYAATNPNHDAKRAALALAFDLRRPVNHAGRNSALIWGVNRQGCRFSRPAPWMARGGGPSNHWRITGTPSLSEVPSGGAIAFCLLLRCSKVSRRQGGTLSGRYLNNGYVPGPTVLLVRPSSQASQLPQGICPSHI